MFIHANNCIKTLIPVCPKSQVVMKGATDRDEGGQIRIGFLGTLVEKLVPRAFVPHWVTRSHSGVHRLGCG